VAEHGHGDCGEFGHIHFHKIGKFLNIDAIQKPSDKSGDDDDNCHEGKSIAGSFILQSGSIEVAKPVYEPSFEVVFSVDNNFPSPYLEPRRKPPRLS
jgi:hypothetical protein